MRDVLVLGYHAVSADWSWKFSVTPERLHEQIRMLLRRGYRPSTFGDAVGGGAERTFAVTFDDAFASVAEHGHPVLRELGVPATVFAVTEYVGTSRPLVFGSTLGSYLGGPHEHELRAATWDELRALAGDGWEIGAHSRTHPALTQLDDASLDAEVAGSRDDCEQNMQRACRTFAYPFGDYDARVRQAVHRAGFTAAALFPPRFAAHPPYAWPRVGVYYGDGPAGFRLKVAPAARRVRGSRAWPALRRVARAG